MNTVLILHAYVLIGLALTHDKMTSIAHACKTHDHKKKKGVCLFFRNCTSVVESHKFTYKMFWILRISANSANWKTCVK